MLNSVTDCDMGQYAGFVYGSGITSLGILLVAICCYIYMRARLGFVRDLMPFRCRFASGLFYLCVVKASIMVYFLFSVTYQITHGRPVCRGTDDWSYSLGWVDWGLIFVLMTWGGALLLVLLWNMYGDMREAGRGRRPVGDVPSIIERMFAETQSAREFSDEARARAARSSQIGEQILRLLEAEPTLWDSVDKLTAAIKATHEEKMEEVKEELIESVDQVKEELREERDTEGTGEKH